MRSKIYFTIILISIIFSAVEKSNGQSPNWLWAKSVGGSGNEVNKGVAVDDSGYVYTIGTFEGTVDFDPGPGTFNLTSAGILDFFILKLDSAGNFVWAKSIGGTGTDAAYGVTVDASGNIYVTGRFNGQVDFDPGAGIYNLTSAGYMDVFVLNLRNTGDFNWAKSMGGTGDDEAFSVHLDNFGNVYITGYFEGTADFNPDAGIFNLTSNGGIDAFVCKLENGGNFVWAVSFGGVLGDGGASVAVDSSANVYTIGHFNGTVDFNPGPGTFNLSNMGGDDIYISKLDALGNFIWAKTMGGNQTDWGTSITADVSGNIYSTGNFRGTGDFNPGAGTFNLTSAGDHDIFISSLDDSGSLKWAGSMGSSLPDYGYSIAVDAYNNIYTTGLFRNTVDFNSGAGTFNLSSGGDNDIFISKLDSAGNFLWAKKVGGPYSDEGASIAFDHLNHLILSGTFMSHYLIFGSDTCTNNVGFGTTADVFVAMLDSGINTTAIENFTNDNGISVYPNPASELITISYPSLVNKNVQITITDVTGKTVYATIKLPGEKLSVDTKKFADGIYFVQVLTTDFISNSKVIVTH
ncbi:MAG: SBBP repeat-containing protein [Bacteroidia bacterium]